MTHRPKKLSRVVLILTGLVLAPVPLCAEAIILEGAGYFERVNVDRARTLAQILRAFSQAMRRSVAVYGNDYVENATRSWTDEALRDASDFVSTRNWAKRLTPSTEPRNSRRFQSQPLLGYGMRGEARSTSRYGPTGSIHSDIHYGVTGSTRSGIQYGVTGSARNGIQYGVSGPVRIGIRYGVTEGTRGNFRYGFQAQE